jgi:hypothetical protein
MLLVGAIVATTPAVLAPTMPWLKGEKWREQTTSIT